MRFFLAFLLSFLALPSKSQNPISSPKIINYSHSQYKGGLQNWDVAQDENGVMYFGNNEGLLSFNGSFWKLYRLPNLTVVRSVEIDSKNRIFVGGQDEIGYFFPDKNGVLKYHSLISLVPEKHRKFADVWNISVYNDEAFFRSNTEILHFKDGRFRVYKPEVEWQFLTNVNNKIYAQSLGKGLMVYDNGVWNPIVNDHALNSSAVTSILEYKEDTLLVATLKNGLFLLTNGKLVKKATSLDLTFLNDRIYCATRVNKDWYAFGTTSAGVIIMDNDGQLIQQYSYQEGLQKNNVRALLIDENKSLWLGMDDGIDFISINSAIKHIYPDKTKLITGYATRVFKDVLYLGTSNGLYAAPINPHVKDLSLIKGAFTEVKNAKGQVWNLEEINSNLLMGHEEGFFTVEGNYARQLYSFPGTWLFLPVSNVFPTPVIIAGTYNGLQSIHFSKGRFADQGHVEGITESLRFLALDNSSNTIWASHPYRGVFQFELSVDYKRIIKTRSYSHKEGLPSGLYNYVFPIKNRIVVASKGGIYQFNTQLNRFQPYSLLNDALKGLEVQYLKEDKDGNVWFVSHKKVGVIDFKKSTSQRPFSIIYFPELDGKVVGGFESIYPLNNENIFIGGNKGVFHVNYKKYSENTTKPTVLLGQVKVSGKEDSVIFGGYFVNKDSVTATQKQEHIVRLPYSMNSVHFEYSSTLYDQQDNVQYSSQLQGFDRDWSPWTDKSERDYTNLPKGDYTFMVKARNNSGNESSPVLYHFSVKAAWYQSNLSYLLYLLILAGVIYLGFKWQKKKYLKEQEHYRYLHQLELERNEKEIVRLKNEKLETEVNFKSKELAGMAMHMVQRGEVLTKIKEVISGRAKEQENGDHSQSLKHILRLIREVERTDEDWDSFTMHFDTVNSGFFDILKEKYPSLTSNELKLSAYLKMNLSTKEIAQLMNITIKGVEVARYRLRKKLQLPSDTNLYDFLVDVSKIDKKE